MIAFCAVATAAPSWTDSTGQSPLVGRPSVKIPSTRWVVATTTARLPATNATYAVYRDGRRIVAAQDDSVYIVLPPARGPGGEPDPHTDTAWTWLVAGLEPLPFIRPDTSVMAPDTVVLAPGRTVRAERDSLYYYGDRGLPFNNSTETVFGEGWYWQRVRAGSTALIPIDLPDFTSTGEGSVLRLQVHSSTAASALPTHRLAVSINGLVLDTVQLNGYESLLATLQVPTPALVRGTNVVAVASLTTGAAVNEVYLDWCELTAPQDLRPFGSAITYVPRTALNARVVRFVLLGSSSDPITVLRLAPDDQIERWPRATWNGSRWQFDDTVKAGRSYVMVRRSDMSHVDGTRLVTVPDPLDRPAGADHVIIAPKALVSAAERLRQHRALTQGLRVQVVTLEDIVDAFGNGRWGPDPLRRFLLTIDTTWAPPAYGSVLLFGDGTWDPKDHFGTGRRGLIPTLGNPVSDMLYVVDTVDRYKARKAVGRIPVRTISEADSLVDALIAYEAQPISDWNRRFLFFAAGFDTIETKRFQQFSDLMFSSYLQSPPLAATQARIYRTIDQVVDLEQTEEVRRLLDSGAVWINFYGHAGTDVWANGVSRPDQLANAEQKAHLITDISCSTARFAEPFVESFSELVVRSTTARAAAYIGSSGFGYESPLRILADGIFKSFSQGERRLGALHLAAKQELWKVGTASLTTQQALHQWTLIGDPLTRLRIARWPEFVVDDRLLTVTPAEPSEQDSIVRVECVVRNIGLLSNAAVPLRLTVLSEAGSAVIETTFTADRRVSVLEFGAASLRTPGFLTVTVSVNPDSTVAEETLKGNSAEIRYVVSSSRFQVLAPLEMERRHPDSVRVVILQPVSTPSAATVEVELDSTAAFAGGFLRRWTSLPAEPMGVVHPIPAGVLTTGRRYFIRTRIVTGISATPWSTRSFTTGASESWVQDGVSGWDGSTGEGALLADGWRLEERRVPVRVFSAGFSDGVDAAVWLNDADISQGFVNRGFNVAVVDETNGRLLSFGSFSIYSDTPDTMKAEPLIEYLRSIPSGRRVLVAVSDEGSVNKTERLNRELESIGSAMIRLLGFRGSWAISGWKGAPVGSVPEARTDEFQGAVTVRDTIEIRANAGMVVSAAIGPAGRWHGVAWSVSDTGNGASVVMRAIRSGVAGVVDTLTIEPGPLSWPEGIRSVRLLAEARRSPGGASPRLTAWRVQHGGLPELATAASRVIFESDSVASGEPLRVLIPVRNIGGAPADSVPYRVRWRWLPTGEMMASGRRPALAVSQADTVAAELSTSSVRGPVDLEVVLDPLFAVPQWERGNDIVHRSAYVFPDTSRPRFVVTIDGGAIVNGDYVRPQPDIRIDIADDGAVPIASPSLVDLRLNGRRVSLSTTTPDSSFESQWSEKKAVAILRPRLGRGTHTLSVQVTDGSGNLADTAAFSLTFRVETSSAIRDLAPYPNPFAAGTDLTFNLTGQSLPDDGSVRIYTVAGRLIREIPIAAGQVRAGFNTVPWDGRDGDGEDVANGVYLAVLKLKTGEKWLLETAKLAKVR
ncbi:MAG: C25 family cysteine peptidase [Bacteroidetes bacterium]|nr:C25 family cysteine peptidase [Bacteroidota bacterium]